MIGPGLYIEIYSIFRLGQLNRNSSETRWKSKKLTVNGVISSDKYPQSAPEKLFSKIEEDEDFSKIDLIKAFYELNYMKTPGNI